MASRNFIFLLPLMPLELKWGCFLSILVFTQKIRYGASTRDNYVTVLQQFIYDFIILLMKLYGHVKAKKQPKEEKLSRNKYKEKRIEI